MNRIKHYLVDRPDVQKILVNAGWLFSDRVLRLIVTVIVSAWVARYLGTRQYGQLNLAIAYIALAMPIAQLGLSQIVIKHLVETPETNGEVLGTAYWMRLLATLALLPIILLIVNSLHPDQPIITILTLLLAIGAVFQAFDILNSWFQARVESKHSVITANVSFLFISLLKILAILASGSLLIFGLLYLLDTIISMLLLLWVYLRKRRYKWSLNWQYARTLLREGAPLIIAGMAVSVYMRIDQIMLGQLLPINEAEDAVGVYAAAVRISEMWYFVPAALIASVFPALLESKLQSETLYRKRLQRLFNLLVLISYAFAIPITVFSGIIINILFGSDFADSAPVLAILVWAGVWVSLGLARSQVLIAENKTWYSMWATLAGAILNIILNLLMIPSFGAVGCAIATFFSYGLSAFVSSFFFNLSIPLGNMQTLALLMPNPFARE